MFTAQAPAIADGLRAVAGDDASAQLLQAFANCNSSLRHRGSVSLENQRFPNLGGVMRPMGNGGGVSGVSRGGPAGGPGQQLKGGVSVPDPTQRVPPWGLAPGVGSGRVYPNANWYGGNYYGANNYNQDFGDGEPTAGYMTNLPTGGAYYDNSSYYPQGGYSPGDFSANNIFIELTAGGGNYSPAPWNTVNNSVFFSFPQGPVFNETNYSYGGDIVTIEGDTILGNTLIHNTTVNLGNGQQGPAGDPGPAGGVGPAGAPGAPGDPGPAGGVFPFPLPFPLPGQPQPVVPPVVQPIPQLPNPLRGNIKIRVPVSATIDDDCKITLQFATKTTPVEIQWAPQQNVIVNR